MFGKVLCLYLMQLLFMIIGIVFVWLSGVKIKTVNIWKEIILVVLCLAYSATLFHVCNYAHYFANTVRYQKTLYEDLYVVFVYVTL
jgi:hypothetical protein